MQDVISHYEEFLGELVSARFSQYSLNELGRKSQNVEIEGFATVEVFYDDEAFVDEEGKVEEVVLEANRLVKPEEEGKKEGEKLTEEQVEAMKEHSIYEGSDALDIRFVSKNDRTKEIEPKVPVSVRLTFDKKAVPEEATADTIAIHHLLESKEEGSVELVETILCSETEKKAEKKQETIEQGENAEKTEELSLDKEKKEEGESKVTDTITKEFIITSFSPFVIKWNDYTSNAYHGIRLYYVDREGREIGPTKYYRLTDQGQRILDSSAITFFEKIKVSNKPPKYTYIIDPRIKYDPDVFRNGTKVPVTIDRENHEVTILLKNEAGNKPKLSITVDNLDSEKYSYHVCEYINGFENSKAKAVVDPDDSQGSQYRYVDGGGQNGSKTIDNTACGIFKFENSYQKEEQKKTITIKKIVEEFGGTAISQKAENKKFDFYIALFRRNGSEYVPLNDDIKNFGEISAIINKWIAENPGKGDMVTGIYKDKVDVPVGNGKTVSAYMPKISLKHGESISLNLDANMYYKILESKDEGYEAAKAVVKDSGHESPITITEVHINKCDYSTTDIFDQGKEKT